PRPLFATPSPGTRTQQSAHARYGPGRATRSTSRSRRGQLLRTSSDLGPLEALGPPRKLRRRTAPLPLVDGADGHVVAQGCEHLETRGHIACGRERGRELRRAAQTVDVPFACVVRDLLDRAVAAQHRGRRL